MEFVVAGPGSDLASFSSAAITDWDELQVGTIADERPLQNAYAGSPR